MSMAFYDLVDQPHTRLEGRGSPYHLETPDLTEAKALLAALS